MSRHHSNPTAVTAGVGFLVPAAVLVFLAMMGCRTDSDVSDAAAKPDGVDAASDPAATDQSTAVDQRAAADHSMAGDGGADLINDPAGPEGGSDGGPPDAVGPVDAAGPESSYYVYVSGNDPSIRVFKLDRATGTLAPGSSANGGSNPSFLAVSPARRNLYAVNEAGAAGRVLAFSIDPASGALARLNDVASGGNGPTHLSVHSSGRYVMVAHYGSGHVSVIPIEPTGRLGGATDMRLAGMWAHQVLDHGVGGRFVFVPCKGADHVAQYAIDLDAGRLAAANPATVPTAPGAGPRHMAFHPTRNVAYLINEIDDTMTSFRFDPAAGTLSDPHTISTLPSGADGSTSSCAEVVVAPSGRFVYGSNRGHDSIVIYAVDDATGRLSLVGHEQGNGAIRTPRSFTLDPSGEYLLVANQTSNDVIVFRVGSDGRLTRVGAAVSAPRPAFIGVVPLP